MAGMQRNVCTKTELDHGPSMAVDSEQDTEIKYKQRTAGVASIVVQHTDTDREGMLEDEPISGLGISKERSRAVSVRNVVHKSLPRVPTSSSSVLLKIIV